MLAWSRVSREGERTGNTLWDESARHLYLRVCNSKRQRWARLKALFSLPQEQEGDPPTPVATNALSRASCHTCLSITPQEAAFPPSITLAWHCLPSNRQQVHPWRLRQRKVYPSHLLT